jgi:hypothetical protein
VIVTPYSVILSVYHDFLIQSCRLFLKRGLISPLPSLHLPFIAPSLSPLYAPSVVVIIEALADSFLKQPPLDYDFDAAADEIGVVTEPAHSSKIGMRTCTEIFKNALCV